MTNSPPMSTAGRLGAVIADIKIAHSVFALPFALLGAAMAATDRVTGHVTVDGLGGRMLLVVLAMIAARTGAMTANRLTDHHFDARNPRTAQRALPSGRAHRRDAWLVLGLSTALFTGICGLFLVLYQNPWPLFLTGPVLVWLYAYGLLKRVTAFCHLYLGASLAMSPLAAAIAIHPEALATPALWLLALMVIGWVSGFDIIYALQDETVDRSEGLHSIPSKLGAARAILVSRLLHAFAAAALIGAWWIDPRFGAPFGIAAALTTGLLLAEQATVSRWGTTRMALTFFTINGIVSCLVGAVGIVEITLATL